ncbi:hypothetical protein Sgou_39180 [Streptomyces gougerotii]|uniref:Uncharacterized protein n=2 Tax=Streptomyces TaxID=1883 RepID=A0A8H9HBT9_9ACTN|nr:hypothetical protein Sgou_39180 [Streptomyces gougerotii]GGU54785.1 hypothetical protein GCM10010227_05010 [Streptomyces gougerotii]SUP60206.1 Uncharacterised protein [Streptomyces griseus]
MTGGRPPHTRFPVIPLATPFTWEDGREDGREAGRGEPVPPESGLPGFVL